ncbi:DUTPase [Geobacillus thermoleovorans CCB_US3_UF5]|uniref:dUTPase n=3 Tax=root TaxID=1 RepID=U2YB74_GEOKU|nr:MULTISPECIES: dUTP diphosphatase [Geobacillus thermoleovorans group]YP_008240342.1 nucleoside triphosphate pyrophosphohydrolase [Thermus phage phi OH2]AEV17617.1 DUTPase [Geobacillus thermoleovorans CCB_US3_UF5]QDY71999.1 dUTPase [Geobacillus thermoleovorans]BAN62913.1 DUTPase [Thermus phage phi OH2]GAD14163.1 DUTPase [Geobacillus kaustophilus GBlys]
MNLAKLFELQRQLDEHIEREHPRQEGEDRLAKKILALKVEIGELANELPEVFKFWSHKKNNREKALKEYVDCLHFLLSIGNDINMNEVYEDSVPEPLRCDDIIEQFMYVNDWINYFYHNRHEDVNGEVYDLIFSNFLGLGEMLGFSWKEIEEAYMRKNEVNHKRQDHGY